MLAMGSDAPIILFKVTYFAYTIPRSPEWKGWPSAIRLPVNLVIQVPVLVRDNNLQRLHLVPAVYAGLLVAK